MLKKSIKLLFFLCLGLVMTSSSLHKFYLSHYTVEYKKESLQIVAKVFTDDMEKALQTKEPTLRIDEKQDPKILGPKLNAYYEKHLSFKDRDTELKYRYVGYELENDVIYIYFEVPDLAIDPGYLSIFCDALFEIYPDQVNLFRVDCGTIQETFTLKGDESSIDLN